MTLLTEAIKEVKRNNKLKYLIAIRAKIDIDEIERIINDQRKPTEEEENIIIDVVTRVRSKEKVIDTTVKRFMETIFKIAIDDKKLFACFGPVGSGKTFIAKNLGIEMMQKAGILTIYYHVPEVVSNRVKDLLLDLYSQVAVRKDMSVYWLYREICDRLRGHRAVLIIDESQRLNVKQLEVIRDLWDELDISIVMLGSFAFAEMIRRRELDSRDAISQFLRRIDQKYILPSASWRDVLLVAKEYGINLTRTEAIRVLESIKSWGDLDTLVKGIKALIEKMNSGEIKSFKNITAKMLLDSIETIKNYFDLEQIKLQDELVN